jgi:hypothetical protein
MGNSICKTFKDALDTPLPSPTPTHNGWALLLVLTRHRQEGPFYLALANVSQLTLVSISYQDEYVSS